MSRTSEPSVRTMELGGDQKRWYMSLDRKQGTGLAGLVGGWARYGEGRRLNEGNSVTDSALHATPIGGDTDGSLLVVGGTAADG